MGMRITDETAAQWKRMVTPLFRHAEPRGGVTQLTEEFIVHYFAHNEAKEPVVCPEGTEVFFPSMRFNVHAMTGAATREKSRSIAMGIIYAPMAHMTLCLGADGSVDLSRMSRPKAVILR